MRIKRQAVRWQINHRGKINPEQGDFEDCTINDISLKGCRVSTFSRLPRNRRFDLNIVLSDDCSIDVAAWVAWHKTIEDCNIYGVCFAKVCESEREKIYKFIRGSYPEEMNRLWWEDKPRETFKEGGETMEEATFEDKRIFERFSVKLPLRYLSMGPGVEGEAETCDVSAKGVGLVARQALPLRTALELWLNIPDKGEPLYARGEVVWSRPTSDGGHRLGINLEKADLMGMSRVLRTI